MTLLRDIFVLSLTLPAALLAQQQASATSAGLDRGAVTWSSAQPMSLLRQLSDPAPGRAIPAYPDDAIRRRKLGSYTLKGLGTGAAIGIVGGVVGSLFMECGCSVEEKTFGLAIWFGGIGASAGGIIGALIGGIADLRAR